MKKVYTFIQRVMKGTVTLRSDAVCCSSRELAEKARKAVIKANEHPMSLEYLSCRCSEIVETEVYETEEEVPILNMKEI